MLASSAVDRGFEVRSGETKDYKIGIYYNDYPVPYCMHNLLTPANSEINNISNKESFAEALITRRRLKN